MKNFKNLEKPKIKILSLVINSKLAPKSCSDIEQEAYFRFIMPKKSFIRYHRDFSIQKVPI